MSPYINNSRYEIRDIKKHNSQVYPQNMKKIEYLEENLKALEDNLYSQQDNYERVIARLKEDLAEERAEKTGKQTHICNLTIGNSIPK